MSHGESVTGRTTALLLVGFALLAIPTGLGLAQGIPTTSTATDAVITSTLPPLHVTETPTTTPTPTPEGNATTGQTHFVNNAGVDDGVTANGGCASPKYTTIQRAVTEAEPGDTVHVCEGAADYNSVVIETANLTLRGDSGAVIGSTGQPAIRSNASQVTIRGFTVHAEQAEYMIAVGGRATRIQNNTVEVPNSNTTGIFLSDGLTPERGDPDPELGAATRSRVLNNTINIPDQAGDQEDPTQSGDGELQVGVFTDADQTVLRDNTIVMDDDYARAIRSAGNRTTIRRNRIRYPTPCQPEGHLNELACSQNSYPSALLLGNRPIDQRYNLCEHGSATGTFEPHEWARQNRVINNSVTDVDPYAFYVGTPGNHSRVTDGLVVLNNRFEGGIGGWMNTTLFKNNIITYDSIHHGDASTDTIGARLCVHLTDSRLIGNRIDMTALINGHNVTIEGNTFAKSGMLINDPWYKENHPTHSVRLINNTITDVAGYYDTHPSSALTITTGANVSEIAYNRITGSTKNGVSVGDPEGCGTGGPCPIRVASFHHNTITGHDSNGIVIAEAATVGNFHHNLIDNNGNLGIHKLNYDKSDNQWPIVDATHNIWGCGGPSSGLEDPWTGRIANGTGDAISAGDVVGKSNIHFDPFFVRSDVSCPTGRSNPTPSSSPTPTPTFTPSSTSSPTPTPTPSPTLTPASGIGNGTGRGVGNGTGGPGGSGTGGSSGTGRLDRNTAENPVTLTPPPTTATPTPPPTPTVSPTPRVEPGFGILTWIIGIAILIGLTTFRRRIDSTDGDHQ